MRIELEREWAWVLELTHSTCDFEPNSAPRGYCRQNTELFDSIIVCVIGTGATALTLENFHFRGNLLKQTVRENTVEYSILSADAGAVSHPALA